jgi:hypothetical protein
VASTLVVVRLEKPEPLDRDEAGKSDPCGSVAVQRDSAAQQHDCKSIEHWRSPLLGDFSGSAADQRALTDGTLPSIDLMQEAEYGCPLLLT